MRYEKDFTSQDRIRYPDGFLKETAEGLRAKVRYLTQIPDKHYSAFHADQIP